MKFRSLLLLLGSFLVAAAANSAVVAGFGIEKFAQTKGFVTSLAFAPSGALYYSVRDGEIYRVDGAESTLVAKVNTASFGNEALLGITFRSEREIIAHYVLPDHTADAIGSVNLDTGVTTVIATYPCDRGAVCPSEHHGGNVIIAPDGSIYFGIGDYGGGLPAQRDESPGGKIHRISASGESSVYAKGLRNPFDLAWDEERGKIVLSDNGPVGEDELNVVAGGDNLGWPYTVGTNAPVDGMVPPSFVFSGTVAPTGMTFVSPKPQMPRGLLVTGFVTKAVYYFADIANQKFGAPVVLVSNEAGPLLDIAEGKEGEIVFASAGSLFRLLMPIRGDANGDRRVDRNDSDALAAEILDGDGDVRMNAHEGAYPGGWGSDVNGDEVIDSRDLVALARILAPRSRPVSH